MSPRSVPTYTMFQTTAGPEVVILPVLCFQESVPSLAFQAYRYPSQDPA